ncbi:hypothetical protein OROHE_024450 [Orobanche hederae]
MNTNIMYHSNIPSLTIILPLFLAITMAYPQYPSPQANQTETDQFLSAHNNVRDQVGAGIPHLVWNETVANYANAYAQLRSGDCGMVHSGGSYGENLAEGYSLSAANAVAMWAGEKSDYDYYSNACAQGKVCGHYTQVVWRKSTQLGCARLPCGSVGQEFVICSYYPPGNYIGESPY